jgi:DNA-binding winged helix-turn-helix (wHTH) protein
MRFLFGTFVLDTETRHLLRAGEPVHLTPKAFELLQRLLQARPRVLSKAELHGRLWPDTHVVEGNLPNLVAEIRSALADEARSPRFVRTVHGLGYAFCGEAVDDAPGPRAETERPFVYRLSWAGGIVALAEGDYVLGRHADSIVPLDVDVVSRRHALLRIGQGRAVLEDLGSHNGTFVNGERLTGPTPLSDSDEFKLGSVSFVFTVIQTPSRLDTRDL